MKDKWKVIIIAACGIGILCALIVSVLAVRYLGGRKEEYRSIKVSDISGTVRVERTSAGVLDAYIGMLLQSEDIIQTDEESYLYLKMDEDKYVLLEPESRARIVASGNGQDSKTSIYLEKGAIVNRLDVDLSEESVYEINTPNSTMAVRGTNFRVEIRYDDNGASYTNVAVFEGTVGCRLKFPDGSVDEKEVSGLGGSGIRIKGDDSDSVYIVIDGPVDYASLSVETLNFLAEVIKEGVPLSITEEELQDIINKKMNTNDERETDEESQTSTESVLEEETESTTSAITKEPASTVVQPEQNTKAAKSSHGAEYAESSETFTKEEPTSQSVYTEESSGEEWLTEEPSGEEIFTEEETSGEEIFTEEEPPGEESTAEKEALDQETTMQELIPGNADAV